MVNQTLLRATDVNLDSKVTLEKLKSVTSKRWAGRLIKNIVLPTGMRSEMVASRLSWGFSCLRYVAYAAFLALENPFVEGPRGRAARAGLRQLYRDCLTVSVNRGEVALLRKLKDLASESRRIALGDVSYVGKNSSVCKYFRGFWSPRGFTAAKRSSVFMQISSFQRALPEPPQPIVDQALADHKEVLGTPFETRQDLVDDFGAWVKDWCHRHLPNSFSHQGRLSISASFELGRASGGAFTSLKGLADWYRLDNVRTPEDDPWPLHENVDGPPRWTDQSYENAQLMYGFATREQVEYLYDKTWCEDHGLNLYQWEELREHLFLRDACVSECWPILSGKVLPNCRQTCVKTRGGKARIVTAIESSFVWLCHMWRSVLFQGLKKWPPTASILSMNHIVATEEWLSQLPPLSVRQTLVRSVDMSAATDRFPLDLMKAAADSIISYFGINPYSWEALVLSRSVGSYNMKCHDGSLIRTRRGILMGLPTSWPFLCLYNGWLWSRANGPPLRQVCDGEIPFEKTFLVCGDDLVGLTTQPGSARYNELLSSTGGLISEGKDYLSLRYGLFTEIGLDVGQRCCLQSVSIKGLTVVGSVDAPSWYTAGPSATEVMAHVPPSVLRSRACALVSFHFRNLISEMRKARIPPFVLRELGGGGFPCRSDQAIGRMSISHERAIRVLMSGQVSDLELSRRLLGLESVWKSNTIDKFASDYPEIEKGVWLRLEAGLREHLLVLFDSGVSTLPRSQYMRIRDYVQSEVGSSLSAYLICRGLRPARESKVTLSKTGRRLQAWIKEINALVPWPRLSDRARDLRSGWNRFKQRVNRLATKVGVLPDLEIGRVSRSRSKRPYEHGYFIDDLFERVVRTRYDPGGLLTLTRKGRSTSKLKRR